MVGFFLCGMIPHLPRLRVCGRTTRPLPQSRTPMNPRIKILLSAIMLSLMCTGCQSGIRALVDITVGRDGSISTRVDVQGGDSTLVTPKGPKAVDRPRYHP